jgi:hypothetical protein
MKAPAGNRWRSRRSSSGPAVERSDRLASRLPGVARRARLVGSVPLGPLAPGGPAICAVGRAAACEFDEFRLAPSDGGFAIF